MMTSNLSDKARQYLRTLCAGISSRRVGSKGNRAATDYVAHSFTALRWQVECPSFACIDWNQQGAVLAVEGIRFHALPSPYTLGCEVRAPLVGASTIQELEGAEITGRIVLLRGEIAKEQLMPKNFVFYNPDHHKRIIGLLESKRPQAIIAATTRDPGMAGAESPFALIEDGDFDIPSVYVTDDEGKRLAAHCGQTVSLAIRAERAPATGCNVIARRGGDHTRRIVLFAHIDAKNGTPGAIDNATGIATLLLVAELLADYAGRFGIEIVALNGEDYYAAPGEMQYLKLNEGKFAEIVLGINLDGAGYREGHTAYSLYDCPSDVAGVIRSTFGAHKGLIEGEPWYQSDHGLFLMNARPALALTSDRFTELWTEIAHTPKDTVEIVDPGKLVEAAAALSELLRRLGD